MDFYSGSAVPASRCHVTIIHSIRYYDDGYNNELERILKEEP
jgi:hypothetical protein